MHGQAATAALDRSTDRCHAGRRGGAESGQRGSTTRIVVLLVRRRRQCGGVRRFGYTARMITATRRRRARLHR